MADPLHLRTHISHINLVYPQVYVPWAPRVHADVRTAEWNLSTTTCAAISELIVCENAMLTLICLASYPVFWYSREDGKLAREQSQNRTCNPYIDGDLEFCTNSAQASNTSSDLLDETLPNYTLPVLDEYKAIIQFPLGISAPNGADYVCQGASDQKHLNTTVTLRTRKLKRTSEPHLLQSGFNEIALIRKELQYYTFDFVYVAYSDSGMHKLTYCPEMICREELTARVSKTGNESWPRIVTALFLWREAFDESNLTFTVANTTIEENFLVRPLTRDTVSPLREDLLLDDARNILLPSSTLLTVQLEIWPPISRWILEQMSLVISELQVNHTQMCFPMPTTNLSATRCGILSVAMLTIENSFNWIQINIRGTRACKLQFHTSLTQTNVTHSSDTGELESLAQSEEEGHQRVLDSIFISVAQSNYFGPDFSGLRIASSNDDELKCVIEVYEGQDVVLNCVVSTCQWFAPYGWCKMLDDIADDDCYVSLAVHNYDEYQSEDQNETRSQEWLDENTIRQNLSFAKVQKRHEGTYECTSEPRVEFPPPTKRVEIIVKVPTAPRFNDHYFLKFLWIPRYNQTATLLCEAYGRPEPTYSWLVETGDRFVPLPNESSQVIDVWPGRYMCIAENFAGNASLIFVVEIRPNFALIFGLLIGFLVFALLLIPIILIIWRWKSSKRDAQFKELARELKRTFALPEDIHHLDYTIPLNAQVHILSYNPEFEIDRRAFTIKSKLLGTGEFGMIYHGELMGRRASKTTEGHFAVTHITIAVKIPKNLTDPQHHRALVDELKIMCRISLHVNVLLLVGACTSEIEQRHLFVLTEYCQHGSLRDYLIENRKVFERLDHTDKTIQEFLKFAYQAANGMEHLAGENIIHRDLALRNLLLTEGHIVKVADFGMSRRHESVYRKSATSDVPLPIFWMALESLISHQYTQKSDVWSFGIVLWEMFSCGRRPYPDYEPDATFRAWLRASEQNRLGPPRIVCDEMFDLMRKCWFESSDSRPTFSQCKRQIGQTLENRSRSMYASVIQDLSDAWRSIPPEILARVRSRRPPPNQTLQEEIDQRPDLPTDSEVPTISVISQVSEQSNGQNEDGRKEESDEGQPSEYVTTLDVDDSVTSATDASESHGTTRVDKTEETRV